MARGKLNRGRTTAQQVRVAVVVVIALLFLIWGVFQVGRLFDVFAERYPLVTLVESTGGLIEGGPVTLAGQRVGQVAEIEFIPVGARTGEANLVVLLSLNEEVREQIREDSRATLRTQGLLGDRLVDISPGSPGYDILDPGDTIPSEPALDYEEVLQTAASTLDDVQRILVDLETVTGSLASGEGTLGALLQDDALYERMTVATTELAQLLQNVSRSDGTLSRLIRDPALYEQAEQTLARLNDLGDEILEGDGTLSRLVTDDSLYQTLVDAARSADATLTGLDRVVANIAEGEGTISRLLEDPELYDQLLKTVIELQTLVAQLRENPEALSPEIQVF